MRGGGTSVAGNAIGPGIVLDTIRHLTTILDDRPRGEDRARSAGRGALGASGGAVAPHGLRFGPDPSTSTRATFGGMIGNNACGPHAVAFGKTSDNVVSLDVIDGLGRRFTAGADGLAAVPGLDELVTREPRAHAHRVRPLRSPGVRLQHGAPASGERREPRPLPRGHRGHARDRARGRPCGWSRFRRSRSPASSRYDDMPAAADAVVPMLAHKPQAVEGLDARLVDARDVGQGRRTPCRSFRDGAGWLFIEVGGATRRRGGGVDGRARGRRRHHGVPRRRATRRRPPRCGRSAPTARASRDAALTTTECWPGWEDAAVPPANLGAYLRDFDALMAAHGVTGQPFGHFGDGCIHVRLDIPLQNDGVPLRAFMEDAAALVARHGGSLSGEHGDGRARSELLPLMYSPEAIGALWRGQGASSTHTTS